jgi:hypothetical protein
MVIHGKESVNKSEFKVYVSSSLCALSGACMWNLLSDVALYLRMAAPSVSVLIFAQHRDLISSEHVYLFNKPRYSVSCSAWFHFALVVVH